MFDFSLLQTNTDTPTLLTAVYSMLLAFLLSAIIAFTYERTTKGLIVSGNFLQAMILGAMAATIVMLAIGDSLARGLGMLGALAIIHFRTNLRNPRNIVFIFAALAIGIACGVYGYNIAVVGTLAFSFVAFILNWTPYNNPARQVNSLKFSLENTDGFSDSDITLFLEKHCSKFMLWRMEMVTVEAREYNYKVILKPKSSPAEFLRALQNVEGVSKIEFVLRNEPDEL